VLNLLVKKTESKTEILIQIIKAVNYKKNLKLILVNKRLFFGIKSEIM